MDETAPSQTSPSQQAFQINKKYRIIYYILGIIETLLALRFFLLLLGANLNAGFSQFIKILTDPLMIPFSGLFPIRQGETSIFSFSIIVAMVIYALLFYGIAKLVAIFSSKH